MKSEVFGTSGQVVVSSQYCNMANSTPIWLIFSINTPYNAYMYTHPWPLPPPQSTPDGPYWVGEGYTYRVNRGSHQHRRQRKGQICNIAILRDNDPLANWGGFGPNPTESPRNGHYPLIYGIHPATTPNPMVASGTYRVLVGAYWVEGPVECLIAYAVGWDIGYYTVYGLIWGI